MAKVKSAERTLRLLEAIAHHSKGLSFSDIQQILNTPKSSTFSLIQELVENDYLSFNDNVKKYVAGSNFIKLAANFIGSGDLVQELKILTNELSIRVRTTSHAGILDGTEVIYLARSEHFENYSLMKQIGGRLPANCTAIGKMLLSQYSDETIRELYRDTPWRMLTANSKKSVDELLEELRVFRKQGYSTEYQEASETSNCIAMPIIQNGKMIASFSCTFSNDELESVDTNVVVETMKNCKHEIESRLELLL
ncbi:IclR family transcriptional regulator [Enterococcus hulanensis]|uniref:IclR family transcriptional regulator n=1 Tax=Enterococcus hulanensis TaxID=2559929 RepID=UPI001A8F24E6|nr:IclR family transcriptional regulator [Enterococcus hulanensis]MBO0455161.1 IclR family transcriptional regulator [Enterococcus hulanensis]